MSVIFDTDLTSRLPTAWWPRFWSHFQTSCADSWHHSSFVFWLMTSIPPWSPAANPPPNDFQWSSHLHWKVLDLHMQLWVEKKKNCYSDFWDTSGRILAFLKPTAKQIIGGKMGVTKKKSGHNTFKSWLKDASEIHTSILSKGNIPTAISSQGDYLLNN